jgi:hypothetical protein
MEKTMEKQIVYGEWYEIDGDNGTEYINSDLVSVDLDEFYQDHERTDIPPGLKDYVISEKVYSPIKIVKGYGARLTMPGFLDATEWAVFETEKEAEEYLDEEYPYDTEDETIGENKIMSFNQFCEGVIKGAIKEIDARTLNDEQKDAFTKLFYSTDGTPNDANSDNPNPWGAPWNFGFKVILRGNTVEDMVEEYIEEYKSEW